MTMIKGFFCSLIASLIIALPAYGGVISHTESFAAHVWGNYVRFQDAYGGLSSRGYNAASANVASFDASLGTLTGVSVSLDSAWGLQQIVRASDTVPENGVATAAAAIYSSSTFTVSQHTGLGRNFFSGRGAIDFVSCSSVVLGPSASCDEVNHNFSNSFDASLLVSDAQFSTFLGPAPVSFQFDHWTVLSGACNYLGSFDAGDDCSNSYNDSFWSGHITVTYTYDEAPVPGPASLFLFVSGLFLMVRLHTVKLKDRNNRSQV